MSLAIRILAPALVLAGVASFPAYAASADKTVSCSSNNGDRVECAADLRGYSLADVKQQSRAECVVGRNFGYDDRGVWVDGGCRGAFTFREGGERYDGPRSYGYTEPGIDGEKRVRCESEGGRKANCDADLRGYRFVEVRNLSRADCVIGRNFGYDDRGVWTEEGCRGEFVFADERTRVTLSGRSLSRVQQHGRHRSLRVPGRPHSGLSSRRRRTRPSREAAQPHGMRRRQELGREPRRHLGRRRLPRRLRGAHAPVVVALTRAREISVASASAGATLSSSW